jgi:hypothetical protein
VLPALAVLLPEPALPLVQVPALALACSGTSTCQAWSGVVPVPAVLLHLALVDPLALVPWGQGPGTARGPVGLRKVVLQPLLALAEPLPASPKVPRGLVLPPPVPQPAWLELGMDVVRSAWDCLQYA